MGEIMLPIIRAKRHFRSADEFRKWEAEENARIGLKPRDGSVLREMEEVVDRDKADYLASHPEQAKNLRAWRKEAVGED